MFNRCQSLGAYDHFTSVKIIIYLIIIVMVMYVMETVTKRPMESQYVITCYKINKKHIYLHVKNI
jgi:hypothetical protein